MGEYNFEIIKHEKLKSKLLNIANVQRVVAKNIYTAQFNDFLKFWFKNGSRPVLEDFIMWCDEAYDNLERELNAFYITGKGEISYGNPEKDNTAPLQLYKGKALVSLACATHIARIKKYFGDLYVSDDINSFILNDYIELLEELEKSIPK